MSKQLQLTPNDHSQTFKISLIFLTERHHNITAKKLEMHMIHFNNK